MASLKNIKIKIYSIKKTSTVTRAMEAVSAVKMRKAQERALGGRSYAVSALSVLQRLSGTVDMARHPLMKKRDTKDRKSLIIVITSDKGLAGALNSSVIRRAEKLIAEHNLSSSNTIIIGIGKRGAEYFENRSYDIRLRYENLSDGVSETDAREITDQCLAMHASGEIDNLYVTYTNFISTFEQEAVARHIVPITPILIRAMVAEIRPAKGKYAPANENNTPIPASYSIEPNAEDIMNILLPRLLNIAIFHALLESKASEHSARMVAMKNATDNAKERVKLYTRRFNKLRQASITREISEITSGMEAMK